MHNIDEINELIKYISKFPGLGPKSAKRIILKLLNHKDDLLKPTINSMANLFKNIIRCDDCGSIRSEKSQCLNCANNEKKSSKICIVETIADQWSIENSNVFNGYFHILGGTVNNSNNKSNEKFLLDGLMKMIKKNNIDEVIIATSATIEGQTTLFYLQDFLKDTNVKVSKLAQGIPIGGEIDSLDDGTLSSAFKNRGFVNK